MKNHHQAVFSSHSDDISPGRDMSPDRGENIVITKIATVTKMLIMMMMMMMMNRMVKKTRTGWANNDDDNNDDDDDKNALGSIPHQSGAIILPPFVC